MASATSYEQKLYLQNPLLCEAVSTLLSIEFLHDTPPPAPRPSLWKYGEYKLILTQTIFHPQGGGQPSDVGYISIMNENSHEIHDNEIHDNEKHCCLFQVNHVQYNPTTERIEHIGNILTGTYELWQSFIHQNMKLEIDSEKRRLNQRLHSFGHLIDAAIQRLGYWNQLTVGKGYHFPDGPYVEYQINSDDFTRELDDPQKTQQFLSLLTFEIQNLITEGIESKFVIISEEEAHALLPESEVSSSFPVPSTSENSKLIRVVTIAGSSCPCGGTHVQNTRELEGLQVTKIRKKKMTLKISYGQRDGV